MKLPVALLIAVLGYLIGSISFARIISWIIQPDADISIIREHIPNTQQIFESDSISATAVRINMGKKYGCLTGLLDMLKAALPVLALQVWQPAGAPYHFIAALSITIGHDWPVWYRFKGGRGESTLYGGLLVIDFLGVLVTSVLSFILGLLARHILVFRWSGIVLMIPWVLFRTHDINYVLFILCANVLYWIALIPELKQSYKFYKMGINPRQEDLAAFMGMGRKLGRLFDQFSIADYFVSLIQRRKARDTNDKRH
jgi:glycerol-3-phosphate acyltransferase PlsY